MIRIMRDKVDPGNMECGVKPSPCGVGADFAEITGCCEQGQAHHAVKNRMESV